MAVDVGRLEREPLYARTIAEQCNIAVAESAMKWAVLRPAPDRFDFCAADRFMEFAEAHGLAARGHCLCWHRALPDWFAGQVNEGNAEELLREHIRRVVGRYRGRVAAWDVVNEAVEPKDGYPDGLRRSPWLALLGPRYPEIAFKAAHAADPQAVLFYNDYGLETDGSKRAAVLGLLQRLVEAGMPVGGLGLQSHLSADSAGQIGPGLTEFARQIAGLGLKIAITELDVNDDSLPDDPRTRAEAVAAAYRRYVELLLHEPAVTDVLCWGVGNAGSWLNAPANRRFRPRHPDRQELCLLFDNGYRPQLAFYALREALDRRPRDEPGRKSG